MAISAIYQIRLPISVSRCHATRAQLYNIIYESNPRKAKWSLRLTQPYSPWTQLMSCQGAGNTASVAHYPRTTDRNSCYRSNRLPISVSRCHATRARLCNIIYESNPREATWNLRLTQPSSQWTQLMSCQVLETLLLLLTVQQGSYQFLPPVISFFEVVKTNPRFNDLQNSSRSPIEMLTVSYAGH
ncbi:hypothetical protein CEXT_397621 [Caerostris extrusa]|uniref:Uncharacterized protein n=1 Tax=Caerostris extrusa TaxID=172846 RepID=A0AAV4WUB2_CAEEX|nr:hypothetical protein CEXT_397621 [Caerostris extrusa]